MFSSSPRSTLFRLTLEGPNQFLNEPFDYVITVCDNAAETCPVFPGAAERIHWSLPDPAAATGTDEQQQRAFDNTARELLSHLRAWLSLPVVRSRIDSPQAEGTQ